MSRKHHTKHRRGPSRYPARLQRRNETPASVRMRYYSADGREHDTRDAWEHAARKTAQASR